MKTFEIVYSGRQSGGHHFIIRCDKEVTEDAKAFLERQRLPYLESTENHYNNNRSFGAWLNHLTDKEELKEFRKLMEGYFTGVRIIPRHFKKI